MCGKGSVWSQQQKLVPSEDAGEFGYAVTVSGDTALVTAIRAVGREDDSWEGGVAYVFVRTGSTWVEQQKLTTSDGAAYNHLGTAVALSGDLAVVGPRYDQLHEQRGKELRYFKRRHPRPAGEKFT